MAAPAVEAEVESDHGPLLACAYLPLSMYQSKRAKGGGDGGGGGVVGGVGGELHGGGGVGAAGGGVEGGAGVDEGPAARTHTQVPAASGLSPMMSEPPGLIVTSPPGLT